MTLALTHDTVHVAQCRGFLTVLSCAWEVPLNTVDKWLAVSPCAKVDLAILPYAKVDALMHPNV